MTALVDASSAIILCKANLHCIVCEMYNVVMPRSVYDEITGNFYPGAEEYQQLVVDSKLTIQSFPSATPSESTSCNLKNLGQGEHDIIQLYLAGYGDFIIIDDGAAAKYCRGERIPFVNALLIPKIMQCTGQYSNANCLASFKKIKSIGRYSSGIIDFAEKSGKEELSFFLMKNKKSASSSVG